MNDRELAQIGALAMKEYDAWVVRNKARARFRDFLDSYQSETGDWFVREEAEPEDISQYDALTAPAKAAQSVLTTARAATRRSIKRLMRDSQP